MEKQEAKRLGHRLVLVVYPFQGHINPMLQLATILYSKGFSITIAHPQFNSPNHENHPEFHFVSIPDGLSKTNFSPSNFMAMISALNSNCEAPFQQHMEEMMKVEDPHDRVAGVVYDGLMHFAQAVADNLKLPGINVHTSAAATLLLFAVFPDAHHKKGYISFPDLAILDEIDSGLDVDALRDVAAAVNGLLTPKNSVLMITHYARLLNIIKPTYIHVMEDGKILRTGDSSIAKLLEDEGYQAISAM